MVWFIPCSLSFECEGNKDGKQFLNVLFYLLEIHKVFLMFLEGVDSSIVII